MKTSVRTRYVFLLAASLCLAAAAGGCGGGGDDSGGTPPPTATQGTLLVQITDAPLDNLIKFEITVESITLDPGDVVVLSNPVRVELTSLQLSTAVLRLADTVPVGSYNSVTIEFSDPEIKFCLDLLDAPDCSNPVEREAPGLVLVTATVETTMSSFSVSGSSGTALLIDFDLEASLDDNLTEVDPQLTITAENLGAELDEFEAKGRVRSITRDTPPTTGTFELEVFGACQRITVMVDGDTDFEDFDEADLSNDFDGLDVDQVVEVEADAVAGGPIFANVVELEEPDDDEEAEGTIIAESRTGGNVTQFLLLVQELATCSSSVPTDDIITVTVDGGTQFEVDDNDLPGLDAGQFDQANELAVGQKVEVEPTERLGASITAEKIQLKEQTVNGTFLQLGPSSFSMIPRSSLIRVSEIEVRVSSATEFEGVIDITGLPANPIIRVRGLVFFNSATGLYLIEASKVEAEPIVVG